MPIQKARGGYRWGSRGTVYYGAGAKAKAARQGRAIQARKKRKKR